MCLNHSEARIQICPSTHSGMPPKQRMLDSSLLPSTSAAFRTILLPNYWGLKSPAFPRLSAETCVLAFAKNRQDRAPESSHSPNRCALPFSTKVLGTRFFNDLARRCHRRVCVPDGCARATGLELGTPCLRRMLAVQSQTCDRR